MSRYSVVAVWTCPGRQAVEVAYSDVTLSALRNIWPTLAAVDLDEPGAVTIDTEHEGGSWRIRRTDRTVIGCVWGAHRRLVASLGDEAPSYAWCEQQWRDRFAKRPPAPTAVPDWLETELFWAWRAETPAPIEQQLALDFAGASS